MAGGSWGGPTAGRVRRDFYVQHNKPKRLFARELCRKRPAQPPSRATQTHRWRVEAKPYSRSTQSLRKSARWWSIKTLPDYRARIGIYPLWSLVTLAVLAHLCGALRGQKDLAKFGKGLS